MARTRLLPSARRPHRPLAAMEKISHEEAVASSEVAPSAVPSLAVAALCPVCGREGHELCGQRFWESQRAKWRRMDVAPASSLRAMVSVDKEQEVFSGTPSTRAPSDESEDESDSDDDGEVSWHGSLAAVREVSRPPLSSADKSMLRSNFEEFDELPCRPLSRPIPLGAAVQVASDLWRERDESITARMARSAQELYDDPYKKFMDWGEEILASATVGSVVVAIICIL
mmetsp:Transcript_50449/g.163279  ORF Transcript_50449/g.163279 Transcript_50449/m.163279 type:complete len:228 (+) Transcript_50449:27-710(+)